MAKDVLVSNKPPVANPNVYKKNLENAKLIFFLFETKES